ncbi:molybdopterin-dependent oxidoreductase [Williamsia sp. CHRR-6]|uniref:molybdopterin-dependent oxidoreductase n=1 Tax=Williamsia sp. CHRR-6 TaxID=2835871 RepID=UPI0027DAF519|nr:molybdopterin-dependent oxidoreductase [Williamsia sp. CHRR-6]
MSSGIRQSTRPLRALGGVIAAGVTLGVGQLVAGFFDRSAAPLFAVGATVIDHTPKPVREFAIDTFGTGDKAALLVGIGVIVTVVAAVSGLLETRRRWWGSAVFAVFGLLGVAAAVSRPQADSAWFLPSAVGIAVGIATLRLMVARLDPAGLTASAHPTADADDALTSQGRRSFLIGASGVGVGAAVAGFAGIGVDNAFNSADRDREKFAVPSAVNDEPIAPGELTSTGGRTPFITPNNDFYRIDTALRPPQVTSGSWGLRIHGEVEREVKLTFADLRRMPAIEKMVTLACVSNEVGGDLIGNAVWTGYRLRDLLAMAGVKPGADMVLSASTDGFTAGTPLEAMTDDRDSLLAVAMNGKPLPIEHGYPARLVVPGLYGYVSATKWVTSLEVTRFADATAYWTTRGWSAKGPIKTSSRIDVPADGASVQAGSVTVAGVAWSQPRGINAVEIRVDDGAWQRATLEGPDVPDAWRMWTWTWSATRGDHKLTVRAFDGEGRQQSAVVSRPDPDGATGLHTISVTVR